MALTRSKGENYAPCPSTQAVMPEIQVVLMKDEIFPPHKRIRGKRIKKFSLRDILLYIAIVLWIINQLPPVALASPVHERVRRSWCYSIVECAAIGFSFPPSMRIFTNLIAVHDRIKYKDMYEELDQLEIDKLKLKIETQEVKHERKQAIHELEIAELLQTFNDLKKS